MWKHPLLVEKDQVFSRREAWWYLVNWCARGIAGDGLQRGEFVASTRELAREWRWSKSRVERFMLELQAGSDPMISRVRHSTGHRAGQVTGHFTICKYETYNPNRDTKRDTARDSSRDTIIKESKNQRENTTAAGAAAVDPPPSAVEVERLSELLRLRIAARDGSAQAAKLPVPPGWARDIEKLIRIDGRRPEDIEAVIVWCQSEGCFWGPNILSGRKLRLKFDTMWGQMKRDAASKTHGADLVGFDDYEPPDPDACEHCAGTGRVLVVTGDGQVIGRAPWSAARQIHLAGPGEKTHTFRCSCPAGRAHMHLEPEPMEDIA